MSNKIITFGATALTALTLTGIVQTASAFADSFNQEHQVSETVNRGDEIIPVNDAALKLVLNYQLNQQNHNWDRTPMQEITYSDIQNIETVGANFKVSSSTWLRNNKELQANQELKEEALKLFKDFNMWTLEIKDISALKYLNPNKIKKIDLSGQQIFNLEPLQELHKNYPNIEVNMACQTYCMTSAPQINSEGKYVFDLNEVDYRGFDGTTSLNWSMQTFEREYPEAGAVYDATTNTLTCLPTEKMLEQGFELWGRDPKTGSSNFIWWEPEILNVQHTTPANNNSIRLNLVGTGSYLFVEDGILYGNNETVGKNLIITKNGQTVEGQKVSDRTDTKFTGLKVGDAFTIQPINNSKWKDEPVTSRQSLGTFDSSAKYTFKVNNDGSISLVATEKTSAQTNSIRLNLQGTGSYLFVENGNLYGNTATVGSSMIMTKNGKTVSQASDNKFTDLKAGDKFTIQPINNTTWRDIPVTSNPRNSLGIFDSSAKYTFKVNNDGSISLVATQKI